MLSNEEIEELARTVLGGKPQARRQYHIWLLKHRGYTFRQIAEIESLCVSYVHRVYKHADAKMEEALLEAEEGAVRLGITIRYGHKAKWKSDSVLRTIPKVMNDLKKSA